MKASGKLKKWPLRNCLLYCARTNASQAAMPRNQIYDAGSAFLESSEHLQGSFSLQQRMPGHS
jgi:hypothetical protein